MKSSNVKLVFTFLIGLFLSVQTFANAGQHYNPVENTMKSESTFHKKIGKQFKMLGKRIAKKVSAVKKELSGKLQDVTAGQLILLGVLGLAIIGLGSILNLAFIATLGGLLVTIAIVVWLLQVFEIL